MTTLSMNAPWAILLSAGRGQRLGGVCKALLDIDGQSLVERQLRAMFAAGIARCIVVTSHQSDSVTDIICGLPELADRCIIADMQTELVHTPHSGAPIPAPNHSVTDRDDIQHSVRQGLRVLMQETQNAPRSVILSLVDLPLLSSPHIAALLQFAGEQCAPVVIPRSVSGQPGHPIYLSSEALKQIDLEQPDFSLRHWLRQSHQGIHVHPMPTDDPGYFVDVDTPDDLRELTARYGLHLRMPSTRP